MTNEHLSLRFVLVLNDLMTVNYIIGIIQVKLQSRCIIPSLKLKYELKRFATIVKIVVS